MPLKLADDANIAAGDRITDYDDDRDQLFARGGAALPDPCL